MAAHSKVNLCEMAVCNLVLFEDPFYVADVIIDFI